MVVEDVLPAGLEIDSVEASGGGMSSTGVPGDPLRPTKSAFGSLDPGATETVTIETTVLAATTGVLSNDARVSSLVMDTDNGNDLATLSTAVEARADLAVSLSDFPDPVVAGNELSYEVSVTNDGPSMARDVELRVELPEYFSFVSSTISGGDGTCVVLNLPPQVVSCDLGDLDPGSTVSVFVTVFVEFTAPDGSVPESTATVSSSTTDPDKSDNSATATTSVISRADVSVTKVDFPDPVLAGEELTCEISVVNNGPSRALDVRLMEELPEQFHFVGERISRGEATCVLLNIPPKTLLCEVGYLDPGETFTVFVTAKADPSTAHGAVLRSMTMVATETVAPNKMNNFVVEETTVNREADLKVEVAGNRDTGNPSYTYIFTVNVTNQGPSDADAEDVVVVETLPLSPDTQRIVYVFDAGGCAVDESTNVLTCGFGTLPARGQLSFDVHIHVRGNPGVITDKAEVRSSTKDPDSSNNTATKDILVQGGATRGGDR